MRNLLGIKKKQSITAFPACYSDAASLHSPFQRPNQKGSLALPTSLEKVAAAAHKCIPQQLPGEDATEDDVRYFLYQILTLKEHEVVRSSPQWILETCMSWHGGGRQLRSLPLDAFQQLCPLDRGHAKIDWTVKGSKFPLEELPPCGIRDLIGQAIRSVVTSLRAKENGHRGPGWQDSNDVRRSAASLSTGSLIAQNPTPSIHPEFSVPSFAAASAYPIQDQFYSFSNHSLPQFCLAPSVNVYQGPFHMQHGISFAQSQSAPSMVEAVQQPLHPDNDSPLSLDDKNCHRRSPPVSPLQSPLPSPALSYAQSDSVSSRISDLTRLSASTRCSASTAKTSPPSSESNNSYCTSKIDRPHSIAQPNVDGQYGPSEMYRAIPQRTSTGTPSRYRMTSNARSFDPRHHMAHLRNPSYGTTALSQLSSTPSHSATDKYGYRRDSAMPPGILQHSLYHQHSLHLSTRSDSCQSTTTRTYLTAPQRGPTPPTLATATPIVRSRTSSVRPSMNYGVDAHAFDTAEQIGYKARPGPIRSMMVDQGKRLRRGKSDNVLHARVNNYCNSRYGEEPVGPHIRFHDPQTGEPRLTMIETIEQRQQLGKQRLEGQSRVERQLQQRLKTVYETIEEQEILNGRPQRGVNNVQHGWASYL